MNDRRGQVLPLAMVGVVLVSLGLYAHHFVASSEYAQVHQIAHAYQTTLVTDAANTELSQQQAALAATPGGRPSPWAEEILSELQQARVTGKKPGSPDGTDKTYGTEHTFKLQATLPVASRVAREGGLPSNLSVDLKVGPFKLVPADVHTKDFYAEPAFGDENRDLVAWNFRGPMTTEVRAGSQVERKTTTLAITDATPPANEFALMSYEPPMGRDEAQVEERAVGDLNHGGRFTVYARQQGRVFVRGPFYLIPEEGTAEDPYLGGQGPEETLSYQERKWINWSTIPGNRALIQPPLNAGTILNTLVSWIHKIAPGIGDEAYGEVIRPELHGTPEWKLGPIPLWPILGPAGLALKLAGVAPDLGPWYPQVSVIIGLAISGEPTVSPGDWTTLIPKDQPGMFAPAAYYHGLAKPGEQTFSILGNPAGRGTGPDADTTEDIYRGLTFNPLEEGSSPRPYEGGLRPAPGKDFDVILPEPLAREEGKISDVGILGYYGVATFTSHSIVDMGIFELVSALFGVGGKLLEVLREVTGISPDLHLVFRTWHVYGYHLSHDEKLTLARITETFANAFRKEGEGGEKAEENSAILAPYGLYFCEHSVHTWDRIKTALTALGALHLVNVGVGLLTNKAFEAVAKLTKVLFKKAPKPKLPGEKPDFDVEPGVKAIISKAKFHQTRILHQAYNKIYKAVFGKHIAHEAGEEFAESVTRTVADAILRIPMLNYVKVLSHGSLVGGDGLLPSIAKIIAGAYGYETMRHPYADDPRAAFTELRGLHEHANEYPNGFYPSKYTSWGSTFTRSYPTMEAYLKNEMVDGALPLRGCVMIKHLDYKGEPIKYRGSGIIVTVTDDDHHGPVLDARVEPAEDAEGNWLTLACLVTEKVRRADHLPSLALGELFTGTVFSQTGVKPAKEGCAILGNLVCGNINKHGIDEALKGPDQGVHVRYAVERLKDLNAPDKRPMWSMEVTAHPEAPPPAEAGGGH